MYIWIENNRTNKLPEYERGKAMEKQAAFKTAVFGFEKESVISYINTLYNDTQAEISTLNKKIESVESQLTDAMKDKENAEAKSAESMLEISRTKKLLDEEKLSAERYADGIRSLNNEINRLKMDTASKEYKIKELTTQIEELEEKGKEGEEILTRASEEAEDIISKAREEAGEILDGAQEDKSKIIFEANADVSEMISRTKDETHRIIHTTNARSEAIIGEANSRKAEIDKITYNLSGDLGELKLSVTQLLAEIEKSSYMAEKLGRGIQNPQSYTDETFVSSNEPQTID